MQAQAEARRLTDTVREAKSTSAQVNIPAMRQHLAQLQRAHEDEIRGAVEADREAGRGVADAFARRESGELRREMPLESQLQQEVVFTDDENHYALAESDATADAVSDVRAHLDRLAMSSPAVQRVQAGGLVFAS